MAFHRGVDGIGGNHAVAVAGSAWREHVAAARDAGEVSLKAAHLSKNDTCTQLSVPVV
ncbi:hypothetical protein M8J71_12335 [Pseudarthrobacter sp. R1]|uniref:hypothetical protein n=1 Tax=Pseudarthrobacter sp. R1 TaxID=2944934 RepID=UPI00210EA3DB|nr:hypothetical protein [Pseudarthrobacter sp. R1]MCQ6271267.1 hypothetical protein [Pseudarthrobacter sp. R1]